MIKVRPIIFYITFFLFVLTFSLTANGYDYDFWARLIAGMGFVQTGQVLKQDFLSYTPTHIWYDHEWGSGVIFYLTQHFFSSAGILFLHALLIFLIFFVITKVVELRGVKTTSAFNFLFYFFTFSAMSQTLNEPIRCQLFTFLFFATFIYILELARTGKNKPLFALPFLMIIWNNLHGGCVSGIGLIIIYIVGEFLNHRSVRKYLYALISTVLVLPINPWGFEYLGFLFKASTMQRVNIVEWWGLFDPYNLSKFFKFKIFALILILAEFGVVCKQIISKTFKLDVTKLLVLAVTLFLAIKHVKMIPLFVISSACFLYDDFYTIFNFLTRDIFNKIAKAKDIIVYGLILFFALVNLRPAVFKPILHWSKYPIRAIEFVKINKIKGNLLIDFGQGSYASYKLYPNNKIFMDGRYEEVYYDYMVPLLKKFYLVNDGWDELLNRFPPDVMILQNFYPVYDTLISGQIMKPISDKQNIMVSEKTGVAHKHRWKLVFKDKDFGVFVKTKNVKKAYKTPSKNLEYYRKTIFDTNINFVLQSKNEQ